MSHQLSILFFYALNRVDITCAQAMDSFGSNAHETHTRRTRDAHSTHKCVRLLCVSCATPLGLI